MITIPHICPGCFALLQDIYRTGQGKGTFTGTLRITMNKEEHQQWIDQQS